MEEATPEGRPNAPETPHLSTPPSQARPSLRSVSNSSTGVFVFSSPTTGDSTDLLSTSPPYPDPNSLPTSPGFELNDSNVNGGRRNASEGSTRAEVLSGTNSVGVGEINAGEPDVSDTGVNSQTYESDQQPRPRLPSQTGRESLGTISRNSTVRSTSNFLGRVGLSPSLDFGRSRRGASEEPGRGMGAGEGGIQEMRRSSMEADYISRRTSLSNAISSSSLRDSVGNRAETSGHLGRSAGPEDDLPALPSPPSEPEEYEPDDGDDADTPLEAEDHGERLESQDMEAVDAEQAGVEGALETPEHSLEQARISPIDFSLTHPETIPADFAGASRRVRPRLSPQKDEMNGFPPDDPPVDDTAQTAFHAMPRSVSSSSSINRTIKANPHARALFSAASPPKAKRHSLSYSFTHSRSSSHTSTSLSTSPGKVKSLANGRSKDKGKARLSVSPTKGSQSLWEDVDAGEAALSGESEDEDGGMARSPQRNGGGDELDERIRQAEEKIRASAVSRASRTRASMSVEPESTDSPPIKSQIRDRESHRRHDHTPSRADTLRRTATMGSAERSSRTGTPVKQEPGDWVQGLEEQGEQRASGSSSNSGKRLPLPAEFRQSNSLFTPSPKVPATGLPRRQSPLYDSPTSVKSSNSRFLDSPSLASRDLDRTRSTTPSSKRYSGTVSRSGSGSQYDRRQWSESISGLPSRYDAESRAGASTAGLPTLRPERRGDNKTDTIRDHSRYRSNPSTLSSRAPLTPGDSVSAVGIPPYTRAAGGARASSMMPPHAQSEVGLDSGRKDKDPLDVIRRMERSREASNRQWTEDRAASVLGHSSTEAYNGLRSASRVGYATHSRGESSQYVRAATSMSSLRGSYDRDAPRTAPADRRQSRRYDDADPVPEVPSWQADSPLAQRRQGKHMSLAPSAPPPRTEPRPMRSSTSLGGRSSTSASMSHGASVVLGTSKTAHGKLLFDAAQALEGRLPVDGDRAVELVRAVRGSAAAVEATNEMVRGISARLAGGAGSEKEDLDDLANEIREASKKSDLAVRELTRVLLDLPRLLRDAQSRGHSNSSRQDSSTGSGEIASRYTPSRLSVIRDDSFTSATASRARGPLSTTRVSVDDYARPQSVVGNYSRYTPSRVEHASPTRTFGQRVQQEQVSPSKGMRPSTSLGGFVARLRSPRKESMPAIDDSRSSLAESDIYAGGGEGRGAGRSALDLLRKTSMRDSTSRMRGANSHLDYDDGVRGTQSMDVSRPYQSTVREPQSSLHARTRSYSPSKDSMISDHTATTTDRANGRAREDGPFSTTRQSLRKKASVISTNTVRAVSGFAPNLMGKLPPATPATTDISYITAGDISPTVARAVQQERAASRSGSSPAYAPSDNRTHNQKRSTDSQYSEISHSGSRKIRASFDEVEPSSPMSRYGLAHRPSDSVMPDLHRSNSAVSSRSGTQSIEQGMRDLGLGRPDSRMEEPQAVALDKSKLARLTSWRLKR